MKRTTCRVIRTLAALVMLCLAACSSTTDEQFPVVLAPAAPAEARITRIVIDRTEVPTFGGASFGDTGPYEKIVGRAFGEVDPHDPLNAGITDIERAPRNGAGKVEYDTDFYLLKPVDMTRGNGILLYDAVNRGNKTALDRFNIGAAGDDEPTDAGDGFLQQPGYAILWSGWQGDVLPGDGRLTIRVPIATDGGAPITGRVRTEYIVNAQTSTQNLSSSFATGLTHASYETVSLDNTTATLTARVRQADPRERVGGEGPSGSRKKPLTGFAQKVVPWWFFYGQNGSIWSRKIVKMRPKSPH